MARRILIAIFAAIFCIGVITMLNRTPKVDIGTLTITCNGEDVEIKGYEHSVYRNDTLSENADNFDIKQMADKMQSFDQEVKENGSGDTVTINTDMCAAYYGRFTGAVNYSFYNTDGELITENSAALNLPTKNIDGCIVRVDVKWGREKNYSEYYYFFRVNYIKS